MFSFLFFLLQFWGRKGGSVEATQMKEEKGEYEYVFLSSSSAESISEDVY